MTRGSARSCLIVWASGLGLTCGPLSPEEALPQSCDKLCSMAHGLCYGEGIAKGSYDWCFEWCAEDAPELANSISPICHEDFATLMACKASQSCEEFLQFDGEAHQKCGPQQISVIQQCPGVLE